MLEAYDVGHHRFRKPPFTPSTRKRIAGVFKNLHSEERFLKRGVFGDRFHRIRVDGRPNRRKKCPFSNKEEA